MAKIVFAFCSPLSYLGPVGFQQVTYARPPEPCSKLCGT